MTNGLGASTRTSHGGWQSEVAAGKLTASLLRLRTFGTCNPSEPDGNQSGPAPGVANKARAQLANQLFQVLVSVYAATHVNGDIGAEISLK